MSEEKYKDMIEQYNTLQQEERIKLIINAIQNGIFLGEILLDEDKKLVLDSFEDIPRENKFLIFEYFKDEDIIKYMNLPGIQALNMAFSFGERIGNPKKIIKGLNDDLYKTIALLDCMDRQDEIQDIQDFDINNDFYRSRAILLKRGFDKEAIIATMWQYRKLEIKINQMKTEGEKTDFILQIEDNDIKLEFLKQIQAQEERNKIIASFQNEIQQEIEPYVQCVQDMIREYFEDTSRRKI